MVSTISKNIQLLGLASTLAFIGTANAWSAQKSYQVTGNVVSVNESTITVDKDKEKFEMARSADTKTTGDVKVGDKVMVKYTMQAVSIELKGAGKADAKAGKKK